MRFYLIGATILVALATPASLPGSATSASTSPCPRQPMPPALDFRGPWDDNFVMDSITFAATPSGQAPGRSWLVRMHRFGSRDIKLTILKLQNEANCNRYRIEQQWTAPMTSTEYDRMIALVEPFVTPPDRLFVIKDPNRGDDVIATDGTALQLRTQTLGWKVSRDLHESSPVGQSLSAIFRQIVVAHVPAHQLPTQSWRQRRSPPIQPKTP